MMGRMTHQWTAGNANEDNSYRGWLVGHFVDGDGPRRSTDVEIKWATHPAGDARATWSEVDSRTTLTMLISGGPFVVKFEDGLADLEEPGDYALWGPGLRHTWSAADESVMLTVRWPSI